MGQEKFQMRFRFAPRQDVWFMLNDQIQTDYIKRVEIVEWDNGNGKYIVVWMLNSGKKMHDHKLFASKLELICHLTGASL